MGMLNRLLGTARTATNPTRTARTGRTTPRPKVRGRGAAAPVPAAGGLGGIARRLMGGRRGGL